MANEVSVEITVEEKAALKALSQLTQGFDQVEKKAVGSTKKMDMALASFAGNVAANVAGKALGFLVSSLGEVVNAAQRQEDAINSLNAALRQSGEFSQATSEDLQDFASSLQKITRFGDEAIIEQLAFAKSMGATTEQAKKIVAAATDMSAALNMDFNSAVRNITKTLGGLKGELGESISELGLLTKEQLQAGGAIDLIANKFSGQASAATQTYSGKVEQLSNSWGDFLESVGMFVTKNPAVLSAIGEITKAVGVLNDLIGTKSNSQQIDETAERYKELSAEVANTEAEIKKLRAEGGFFSEWQINSKTKDLQMMRMELNKLSIDQEKQRMIQKAQAEEEMAAKSANKAVVDPTKDPRYIAEMQLQAELKMMREQADLVQAESELRKKEAQGIATQEDMEALRNIELMKIDIVAQSELEKAALIQDSKKREQEIAKINAKYSLDIASAAAKQEVEIEKQKADQKKAIQQAQIQTTQNFLSAGIALAKQGSNEQKALMTANALVSTYAAATQALKAPPGPPWSFALAASTVAMGLANVAKINSQSFATGGVVGGFTGASMGMDNTTANVRTGEMVLTGNQQRQLFEVANGKGVSDDLAGEIRGLRGDIASQPIIVEVNGVEIARAVRDAREMGVAV
jgi:hypothetical protein